MKQAIKLLQLFEVVMPEAAATIRDKFTQVIDALEENDFDYVIGGSIALGVYAAPKTTADVDIIIDFESIDEVRDMLHDLGFRTIEDGEYQFAIKVSTDFEFEFLFGTGNPEIAAIVNYKRANILGRPQTKVIAPEYLMWMYLWSNQAKHREAAINLLKSKKCNTTKLIRMLDDEGDSHLVAKLAKLSNSSVTEDLVLESYSEMIIRRTDLRTGRKV